MSRGESEWVMFEFQAARNEAAVGFLSASSSVVCPRGMSASARAYQTACQFGTAQDSFNLGYDVHSSRKCILPLS